MNSFLNCPMIVAHLDKKKYIFLILPRILLGSVHHIVHIKINIKSDCYELRALTNELF